MSESHELAFFVEHEAKFDARAKGILRHLAQIIPDAKVTARPTLIGRVVQVGPRMSMVSPWSSSAVGILHGCGIQAERFEMLRRHAVPKGVRADEFAEEVVDLMTEQIYDKPISTFSKEMEIPKVETVPILQRGADTLREISERLGLGFDGQDVEFYRHLFAEIIRKNPTNGGIFALGQVNSNHCRHLDWNAEWTINWKVMRETLFELIQKPYLAYPGDALAAFHDNSSVVKGFPVKMAVPKYPWKSSEYAIVTVHADGTLTQETHNHPTGQRGKAPHPGAGTGTGGRIRDQEDVGVGGLLRAALAGFFSGDLNLPGYKLPWERRNGKYPPNLSKAADIIRLASDGACEYNNPIGEPVILGCSRAVEMKMPRGSSRAGLVKSRRWAYLKPIMLSGGMGIIRRGHIRKAKPKKGMLIVMIGGPAFDIGFGGGSASSQVAGANKAGLDWKSVQRADPEEALRNRRVIDACIALGRKTPIKVLHDQGAGGVINNTMELVELIGGMIHAGKIRLGDKYLPFIVRIGAEYQERHGLLLDPSGLEMFRRICKRENCHVEVLGRITGDGRFVVYNDIEGDCKKPIDFPLKDVMADMPRKRFSDWTVRYDFQPLRLPHTASIASALNRVLKNPAVASKEHYVLKGDRSVGGLVVGQQMCGPANLPVADCGVMAFSHFSPQGQVFSIGEQPLKLMLNPAAGARMSVAEAVLNMAGAKIKSLDKTVSSVNWMWALKHLGEGAAIFKACGALSKFMVRLGTPVRGKDSSSMLTKFDGEIVPCPRQVIITLQGMMPDARKFVTPDFKRPGESDILLIDLGLGKNRMGGSILAQCYNQWGNDCPDITADLLRRAFNAIQELISRDLILSYHDRSDGGLIVALLEMAFAGNCGFTARLRSRNVWRALFSEEAGAVLEVSPIVTKDVMAVLESYEVPVTPIGGTTQEKTISIRSGRRLAFTGDMPALRQTWRETSYQLRRLQINPDCALAEKKNTRARTGISYVFPKGWNGKAQFRVRRTRHQPLVANFREIGTNSDQEMADSFIQAGFRVQDVAMADLETGAVKSLNRFSVLAVCGGFSDGDVLGSARGWAAKILYNEKLRRMFWEFLARDDTLSYWVCNGAQLGGHLRWIPYLPERWDAPSAEGHPIFTYNTSRKFEARWPVVGIIPSSAIMLRGLEGCRLGVNSAHGEGRFCCSSRKLLARMLKENLCPIRFVDDGGEVTEDYPYNPNGSPIGVTGICSPDGRHLWTMMHLERSVQMRQWQYVPEYLRELENSPWLRAFENLRNWYR